MFSKTIISFFEIGQQAIVMLRLWLSTQGNQATGNALEKALRRIGREDIVNKCMFNVERLPGAICTDLIVLVPPLFQWWQLPVYYATSLNPKINIYFVCLFVCLVICL